MNENSGGDRGKNDDNYVEFQAGVTAALRTWSALRTAVEQSWGPTSAAEDLRDNIYRHFHDGGGGGGGPSRKNGRGGFGGIMTRDELEDNLLDYMEDEFGLILEDGSERELSDLICRMYEGCGNGDMSLARSVLRCAIMAEMSTNENASTVRGIFRDMDGGAVDGDGGGDMDDAIDDANDENDDDGDIIMDEGDDDSVGGTEDDDDDVDDGDDGSREITSTIAVPSSSAQIVAMMGGIDVLATDDITIEAVRAYASGALFGNKNKKDDDDERRRRRKDSPPPRQLGEPEPVRHMPVLDDDGFVTVPSKRRGGTRTNGAM
jgi:hypothetical protein